MAYHVTCAFKRGLEMKVLIADENTDDVKLRVSRSLDVLFSSLISLGFFLSRSHTVRNIA